MPIYEYACDACDHTLDALQKISEEPLKFCPECGAESLRKLISAPNFRLKGSGWYETDFKTDNRKNLADDGGKKDAGKDSKKDDSKAAAGESKNASAGSEARSKAKPGGKASASAASSAD